MAASVVLVEIAALLGAEQVRTFENLNPERLGQDVCEEWRKKEGKAFAVAKGQLEACRAKELGNRTLALGASRRACVDTRANMADAFRQAPKTDDTTGLCSWQALSTDTSGTWVTYEEAEQYFGPPGFDSFPPFDNMGKPCLKKRRWYRCPKFVHNMTWLPNLVRSGTCRMTYMTPAMLSNATGGRALRVLFHGDSLFKGLYKALICQLHRYIDWEEHYQFDTKHAEAWVAGFHHGHRFQYVYRDYGYRYARTRVEDQGKGRLLSLEDFDAVVTNSNIKWYRELAWLQNFHGPVIGVTPACARCRSKRELTCYGAVNENLKHARRFGWPAVDLCALTLPNTHGHAAQFAPGGIVLNRGDPHLCSPGPDNQLVNILLHVLASFFHR